MRRQIRDKISTVMVILLALLLMFIIFARFHRNMTARLNETTAEYLSGNVDALATAFQTKLEDQLIMLESQTRYFRDVDLTDYNAMKRTIMSTRGMEAFTSIGVASSAGSTINYLGKSSGNILLMDYFRQAINGESAISAATSLDEFGNEVLVLAVPIRQEDQVVGVIYGTFTRDALTELLNSVNFAENSSNILVTGDGSILAGSADLPASCAENGSLREAVLELESSFSDGLKYYEFESGGESSILVLRPVGYHDWYFGTILPAAVVTEQSTGILKYVMRAMVQIAGVLSVLLLYIYISSIRTKKLAEKANTDLLTHVLNKASFQDAAEKELSRAGNEYACALYMIDLDNFKSVNDTLGHAEGDRVLENVGTQLRSAFRESDLVGRIGGDEFAAFIRYPMERESELDPFMRRKAETLLQAVARTVESGGKSIQVSVSIGVASYPKNGKDYAALYANADKALYRAKRGGKNRYEIFD